MTPESNSPLPSDRTLETLPPPTDPAVTPATKHGTLNTGGTIVVTSPAPPLEVAGYLAV